MKISVLKILNEPVKSKTEDFYYAEAIRDWGIVRKFTIFWPITYNYQYAGGFYGACEDWNFYVKHNNSYVGNNKNFVLIF